MLPIAERLQQNIEAVIRTVWSAGALVKKRGELSPDETQQLAFRSAETSLLALAASDEIDAGKDSAERIARGEAATALRRIAVHLLNVQEWADAEQIRTSLEAASKHARVIARILGVPEPSPVIEDDRTLLPLPEPVWGADPEALMSAPAEADQTARLRGEIRALREILTALLLERDNLVHVICREIEATYIREIGSIEAEIYRAECEVRYLRRKTELMQVARNRREEIRTEQIEEELRAQYEDYLKAYREFIRRVQEAADLLSRKKKKEARREASPIPARPARPGSSLMRKAQTTKTSSLKSSTAGSSRPCIPTFTQTRTRRQRSCSAGRSAPTRTAT